MAETPRRTFHTASDVDIKRGDISDVYFDRTVEILTARNDRKRVKAEVYVKSLPAEWRWGILAGIEEVAGLLEGVPVDVRSMRLAKTLPRSKAVVVGLSGRGDKDVQVVARARDGVS